MSIKLAITGRPSVELSNDNITLGSNPSSLVSLPEAPGIKPNHAVIRLLDGRWVIEALEAEALFVTGSPPKRAHWLSSGDIVGLLEKGLALKFEVNDKPAAVAQPT